MNNKFDNFSKEVQRIIKDASIIYGQIKNEAIIMNDELFYANRDKKCLALLMSILKNDSDVKNLLNDFSITYDSIISSYGFNISNEKTQNANFKKSHIKNNDLEYIEEISELVTIISDKKSSTYTRETNPLIIVSQLLMPLACGSFFFEDMALKLNLKKPNEQTRAKLSAIIARKLEMEQEDLFETLNEVAKQKPIFVFSKNPTTFSQENRGILKDITTDNFTDLAFGRDDEIRHIIVSLLMPGKSALLIGQPGVGKTALIKGLAYRINKNKVPNAFRDKKIIALNVAALVSGCRYVGMFEEKLMKVLEEVMDDPNIILFIDEIHSIVGAGKGQNSSNDMANILKPYLDNGQIKLIGTTTTEEYERYIKPNSGLKRRFEVINIEEPEKETLKDISFNVIDKLCLDMGMNFLNDVYLEEEVISKLIELTEDKHRHYNDKVQNPDLILSIINRSFALAKYYDKQNVEISDLIEAIRDNERIYEFSKGRIINSLMILDKSVKKAGKIKIIKFPVSQ